MSLYHEKTVNKIKEMDEQVAKKVLADIFLKIERIGYGGYTSDQCFEDIQEAYRHAIVYPEFAPSEKK